MLWYGIKKIYIRLIYLYGCRELKELDLSGLQNVTSIGDSFLAFCSGLKELDLSGLQNVTTI